MEQWIARDYVKGELRILAGWDNWMCYHFFSQDTDTDAFLEAFYEELVH